MCTNACRLSAVTGGYCGNNQIEPGESCDGTQVPVEATCRNLGFDYATRQADGFDQLSCTNRCVIAGCEICSTRLEATAANTFEAVVRDGILQSLGLPNARVQLRYNGTPIAETFTDADGRFRFGGIHTNAVCGNYTVVIALQGVKFDYTRREIMRTADPNDGYFTYTSGAFSLGTWRAVVGRSASVGGDNVVLLMPRPGTAETFVIREWTPTSAHPGQLIDPQLLVPQGMGFTFASGVYTRCVPTNTTCMRTINWEQDWQPRASSRLDRRGSLNIAQAPNAGLACYEAGTDGTSTCASSQALAETILYKRVNPVTGGVYRYFLVDFIPADFTPPTNPTSGDQAAFRNPERTNSSLDTRELQTKVRVAWRDQEGLENYREFDPLTATRSEHGDCRKYWHVFDQDAVTGAISEVNRFMCNPQGADGLNDFNSIAENPVRVPINQILTTTGFPR